MPQQLLPPDIRRLIANLESRVSALERRLQFGISANPDEIIFSLPGTLAATTSPPVRIRDVGNATSIVANLGTAGTTTTTIDILRGDVVTVVISLPAGVTSVKIPAAVRFGADQETLSVRVVTAGTGARNLTVQVRFS